MVNKGLARTIMLRLLVLLFVCAPSLVFADGYLSHPGYAAFEQRMVSEHGFSEGELRAWFGQAERKQSILDAISRPAEKRLTWGEYRKIFMTDSRISAGVAFAKENAAALKRAEDEYGVAPEIIVAIIGVETRYGGNMGSYRVIDSLSTLAFDYPPRAKFFMGQLEHFLIMTREQGFDAMELKGSYAGAMGMGQFIPSSFRDFAVDFDGDGKADIWSNTTDAIGSVANYFAKHKWTHGEPVVVEADVAGTIDSAAMNVSLEPSVAAGELATIGLRPRSDIAPELRVSPMQMEAEAGYEYWVGLHNFYVITRYNHSSMYALAVYQLSAAIAAQAQS